jgi:hypothetical protein
MKCKAELEKAAAAGTAKAPGGLRPFVIFCGFLWLWIAKAALLRRQVLHTPAATAQPGAAAERISIRACVP